MIGFPTLPLDHPDRLIDCQRALKVDVFAMLDRDQLPGDYEIRELEDHAEALGWTRHEITAALVELSRSYLLTRVEGRSD